MRAGPDRPVFALRIAPADRLPAGPAVGRTISRPVLWLGAITAIGAALRAIRLGGELWIDEIATVETALRPLGAQLLRIESLNDHVLHTVLMRVAVAAFGLEEWAIRLPAVASGVATIPAVYALARHALGSREALLASAIVASSYHHVLFSQNARGYTMLLFWTALSTLFLLRALTHDRWRDWGLYAATGFLATLTMLLGGLALVGHLLALAVVAVRVRRVGGSPRPAVVKTAAVIGAVGLAAVAFYGTEAFALAGQIAPTRTRWSLGDEPRGFWHDLGVGLRSGLGPAGLTALALAALPLAVGAVRFTCRRPAYVGLLTAPVVPVVALALVDFYVAPRYSLWAIAAFAIGLPGAAASLGRASRWAAPAAVAVVVAASAWSLPGLYHTPKQATRTSLEWATRRSVRDDVIVPVDFAAAGARFYASRIGPPDPPRIAPASTLGELLAIEREAWPGRIWLLTTHRLALLNRHPVLMERIERCYRPVEEFPATIHRMEITVWRGPAGCPVSPPDD